MLFEPDGACMAAATHSRITSSLTGLVKSRRLRTARVVCSSWSGVMSSNVMGVTVRSRPVGEMIGHAWHYGWAMNDDPAPEPSLTTGPVAGLVTARPRRSGGPARSRADRGQSLPRDLTRREPPTRVRRPGGRAGAGGCGPHDRRALPPGALTPRLLPAPGRPDPADPVRGRSHPRRPQLLDPPCRGDPARSGDLQPPGQLPRRRTGPGPPAGDARGDGPSRRTRRLPDAYGAVRRPTRRAATTGRARSTCATSTATRSARRASPPRRSTSGSAPTGDSPTIPCSTPASSPTPAT